MRLKNIEYKTIIITLCTILFLCGCSDDQKDDNVAQETEAPAVVKASKQIDMSPVYDPGFSYSHYGYYRDINYFTVNAHNELVVSGTEYFSDSGYVDSKSVCWMRIYNPQGVKKTDITYSYLSYFSSMGLGNDLGNIFVTGEVEENRNDLTIIGERDIYLGKLDDLGNLIWETSLGSTANDMASAIALDSSGDVIISGSTYGSFDGNIKLGDESDSDSFLVKHDSNGIKQWSVQFGSDRHDSSRNISVDSDNNIYVTGFTEGSYGGCGSNDGCRYITKFNSTGVDLWTVIKQGSIYAAGIDSSDNFYFLIVNSSTESTVSLDRIDSSGSSHQVELINENGMISIYSQIISKNDELLITGSYHPIQDPSGHYAFIAKYDLSGQEIWTRRYATHGIYISKLSVDDFGRIYAIFSSTYGEESYPGMTPHYLMKLDSSGEQINLNEIDS